MRSTHKNYNETIVLSANRTHTLTYNLVDLDFPPDFSPKVEQLFRW